MTLAIPHPRPPIAPPALTEAERPYLQPLDDLDDELAMLRVRARRLQEELAGARRLLDIVATRRRRLLEARARTLAAIELEQLLADLG